MTIVLGSLVIFLTFAVGALFAFLFSRMDRAVINNNAAIELEGKGYNKAMTMGYEINTQAPPEAQIREARLVAAKLAAAKPRGYNSQTIGYRAEPGGLSASVGLRNDPWTASKIAEFHGWDGAQSGIPSGGVPVAPVAAPTATVASGPVELVPGKDYPYIEITDDMSPDEKRKARVANSKAKSAAQKAAKSTGAPLAESAVAPAPASAPAAAAVAAAGLEPPKLIVITDEMSADEIRKARITNSKLKSAFNKTLKAAGIDPGTIEFDDAGNLILPEGAGAVAAAAPVAAPGPAVPAASSGPVDIAALGIEIPEFVVITDDMSPDEVRKARINNSKAKSALSKALKAAGIDPKSVEVDDNGQITVASAAPPVSAEPAAAPATEAVPAPATSGSAAVDLSTLGLAPPEIVEITDDMTPDQKRQARIANSKAKAAFNKALKAAGIDPSTVDI